MSARYNKCSVCARWIGYADNGLCPEHSPPPALVYAEEAPAAEFTPVFEPEARSWDTPSTALVYVTECPGSALVVEDDGQLHLEQWRDNLDGEDHYIDVGCPDPSAVPWGLAIWTGKIRGTRFQTMDGTEYDADLVGDLRPLTDEEWANLRAGRMPWQKED